MKKTIRYFLGQIFIIPSIVLLVIGVLISEGFYGLDNIEFKWKK